MTCVKDNLKCIFVHDHMLMSRFGLAIGSLLWAFQLMLPAELFPTPEQVASGTGRLTYSLMAAIANENIWSSLFAIHGISALYSLIRGVRSGALLWFDGILGWLLWTASTVACFAAYWPKGVPIVEALAVYPPPAAMSADLVLAFFAWWHMIRLLAEEKTTQE